MERGNVEKSSPDGDSVGADDSGQSPSVDTSIEKETDFPSNKDSSPTEMCEQHWRKRSGEGREREGDEREMKEPSAIPINAIQKEEICNTSRSPSPMNDVNNAAHDNTQAVSVEKYTNRLDTAGFSDSHGDNTPQLDVKPRELSPYLSGCKDGISQACGGPPVPSSDLTNPVACLATQFLYPSSIMPSIRQKDGITPSEVFAAPDEALQRADGEQYINKTKTRGDTKGVETNGLTEVRHENADKKTAKESTGGLPVVANDGAQQTQPSLKKSKEKRHRIKCSGGSKDTSQQLANQIVGERTSLPQCSPTSRQIPNGNATKRKPLERETGLTQTASALGQTQAAADEGLGVRLSVPIAQPTVDTHKDTAQSVPEAQSAVDTHKDNVQSVPEAQSAVDTHKDSDQSVSEAQLAVDTHKDSAQSVSEAQPAVDTHKDNVQLVTEAQSALDTHKDTAQSVPEAQPALDTYKYTSQSMTEAQPAVDTLKDTFESAPEAQSAVYTYEDNAQSVTEAQSAVGTHKDTVQSVTEAQTAVDTHKDNVQSVTEAQSAVYTDKDTAQSVTEAQPAVDTHKDTSESVPEAETVVVTQKATSHPLNEMEPAMGSQRYTSQSVTTVQPEVDTYKDAPAFVTETESVVDTSTAASQSETEIRSATDTRTDASMLATDMQQNSKHVFSNTVTQPAIDTAPKSQSAEDTKMVAPKSDAKAQPAADTHVSASQSTTECQPVPDAEEDTPQAECEVQTEAEAAADRQLQTPGSVPVNQVAEDTRTPIPASTPAVEGPGRYSSQAEADPESRPSSQHPSPGSNERAASEESLAQRDQSAWQPNNLHSRKETPTETNMDQSAPSMESSQTATAELVLLSQESEQRCPSSRGPSSQSPPAVGQQSSAGIGATGEPQISSLVLRVPQRATPQASDPVHQRRGDHTAAESAQPQSHAISSVAPGTLPWPDLATVPSIRIRETAVEGRVSGNVAPAAALQFMDRLRLRGSRFLDPRQPRDSGNHNDIDNNVGVR